MTFLLSAIKSVFTFFAYKFFDMHLFPVTNVHRVCSIWVNSQKKGYIEGLILSL